MGNPSVAATPLGIARTGLLLTILTVGTLAVMDVFISYLTLKYPRFRRITQEEPIVLVQNGKVLEDTLRKTRINIDDLLMGIRQQKIPDLANI